MILLLEILIAETIRNKYFIKLAQVAGEIIVFFFLYFLTQVMELNRSESLCHENSFFINEALVQMSLNTYNKSTPSGVHQEAAYPQNIANLDLVRTSESPVDLQLDISQPLDVNHELWTAAGSCHQIPPLHESSKDSCKNGN